MSTRDMATALLTTAKNGYGSMESQASTAAEAAKAAALVVQADEQRIANLINLLPQVDRPSKQNILDLLGHLLGTELVQDA